MVREQLSNPRFLPKAALFFPFAALVVFVQHVSLHSEMILVTAVLEFLDRFLDVKD